ncbi:germin-like protein 3-5 [Miscanthus floridulus]|uniref:germin-like protein 3-5 n=1 Tax=Miscanthus floridulus TaxID=154761 RepID=UPI00345ABB50
MEYSKALASLFTMLVLAPLPLLVKATDPDPLQDFCVADLSGKLSVNGFPCQPSSSAGDEFLFSDKIATGGDPLANPNGSNVTELDVSEWPGVNTLGVSMNRVDFAPGGTNPPHVHPRATEVGLVTRGELLVGIVGSLDSGNRYYSKASFGSKGRHAQGRAAPGRDFGGPTNPCYFPPLSHEKGRVVPVVWDSQTRPKVVRAGETFVIPRGLMHFQFNVGKEYATMVVSFNSQNPGIIFVPLTLFGSSPPIPTPVLAKALRVDASVVDLIKSKFAGGY